MVDGSLYLSMVGAGLTPDQAARVTTLFGRNLDLVRDVDTGDVFHLVFDRRAAADGHPLGPPELLFGDIRTRSGRATLYRVGDSYVAGEIGPGRVLLLRTPIEGARITSSFGMRMHPILGFTRMHQGVDFGAPVGSPTYSLAGDEVVEQARWAGGYGRWLKIRHTSVLETAYAHLSAWAAGIRPGVRVRQGQVVGYVGATGLATGPHLHYEVIEAGRPIDPKAAALVPGRGAERRREGRVQGPQGDDRRDGGASQARIGLRNWARALRAGEHRPAGRRREARPQGAPQARGRRPPPVAGRRWR